MPPVSRPELRLCLLPKVKHISGIRAAYVILISLSVHRVWLVGYLDWTGIILQFIPHSKINFACKIQQEFICSLKSDNIMSYIPLFVLNVWMWPDVVH